MPTMLRRLLLLLAVCALVSGASSCGSDAPITAESSADPDVETDEAARTADVTSSTPVPEDESDGASSTTPTTTIAQRSFVPDGTNLAPLGRRTSWNVVIGDGIEASLLVGQNGPHIHGEITYATSSTPIVVIGQTYRDTDGYFLREFGEDGRVSGTLILGAISNGTVADAQWNELPATVVFDEILDAPYLFDPLIRTGAYEFAYGPFGEDDPDGLTAVPPTCCGPTGRMLISAAADNTMTVSFENLNSAPSYSLAFVQTTTLPLEGNVAHYEEKTEFIDCAFDITVFDGFAYVDYVDDRFSCGFGNAASVVGQYILTKAFSDSAFATSTLSTTTYGDVELGMTWSDATRIAAIAPYDPLIHDRVGESCNYTTNREDPLAPWIMMLGEGDAAVVSRIELPDGATTSSGLGIGSTEAEVRAVYGDAIAETPHHYLGLGAKYLTVERDIDGPTTTSSILFETSEDGVVLAVRNGFLDPLPWIEGCL